MIIPDQLAANCRKTAERRVWLDGLPGAVEPLTRRWSLRIDAPFGHDLVSCSWVAPVLRADRTRAVLKLGMPHMEGADEIHGLRFWNGDPTVRLLEADDDLGAMLLERCRPGDMLLSEPEDQQDMVIAKLLKRLWHRPIPTARTHRFRNLSVLLQSWSEETLAQAAYWPDAGLVREGLRIFEALAKPRRTDVLLATDLHAGNVLRAQREPWLVIDPKPFIGDPPYDLVQHLRNCEERLQTDPIGLVKRIAELAEVDEERLRLWTFARAAADPRDEWGDPVWIGIAKALAP